MVYHKKLVVAVKVNGKVLREYYDRDTEVYLPFGSEYSLYIKNMENRKALVDVKVDGREVISRLIVNANSSTEVERFFEGDMNSGHKLKFIEKTDKISKYRGDFAEDGLVEVCYRFEEECQINDYRTITLAVDSPQWGGLTNTTSRASTFACIEQPTEISASINQVNDRGITVEGGQSQQGYVCGHIGPLEISEHVIIIKLLGGTRKTQVKVNKPVTVKTKFKCKTCGTRNVSSNKFCRECGTATL